MRFTDKGIQNLAATDARRTILASNHTGLLLRVSKARGQPRKVFQYRYWRAGKARYVTLGPYPALSLGQAELLRVQCQEANKAAGDLAALVAAYWAAKLPVEAASRGGPTVKDVINEFLTHYAAKKRKRPEQAKYLLEHNVLPAIGNKAAADVKKRDIVTMLDDIVARGSPVVANRVQALLKQAFAVAADRDLIESGPTFPRAAAGGEEKSRDRVLTDDEIALLWHGLDVLTPKGKRGMGITRPLALALKLTLITAQRRGEVAAARWTDIHQEKVPGKRVPVRTWHIPDNKSDRPHIVPLPPAAWALLEELKSLAGDSEHWLPAATGRNAAADRDRTITKAARSARDLLQMEPWTPHDLRRTARTGLSRLGVADPVAERVLNHVAGDRMVQVYNQHRYLDEMREALDSWGIHVAKIVGRKFKLRPELKHLKR